MKTNLARIAYEGARETGWPAWRNLPDRERARWACSAASVVSAFVWGCERKAKKRAEFPKSIKKSSAHKTIANIERNEC